MRLVTRPDLDGLTCAVILSECEAIDAVELVHPQDVSERRVTIGPDDILANVPYHPDCGMWFDNHLLTDPKAMPPTGFKGRYGKAPSRGVRARRPSPSIAKPARIQKMSLPRFNSTSAAPTVVTAGTPSALRLSR